MHHYVLPSQSTAEDIFIPNVRPIQNDMWRNVRCQIADFAVNLRIKVIQDRNFTSFAQETPSEMGTYEPSAAGYEDSHI